LREFGNNFEGENEKKEKNLESRFSPVLLGNEKRGFKAPIGSFICSRTYTQFIHPFVPICSLSRLLLSLDLSRPNKIINN